MAAETGQKSAKTTGPASIGLGLVAVAILGFLDYLTGPNLSLNLLFLAPVSLVAWSAGKQAGIFIAVASAAAGLFSDFAAQRSLILSSVPYWSAFSNLGIYLIVTLLLPALKKERQEAQARLDYLTGISNKKYFLELIGMEIERARRYRHPFTIAYLDIDNFKSLNQRLGHSSGDTVLQTVARSIKEKIRTVDHLARMGEDEFAMIFPETQPDPAKIVIRRIQQNLQDAAQKNEWPVTFSIGVATFMQPPDTAEQILKKLQELIASVKTDGKNAVKHEIIGQVNIPQSWS